jgi:hypothetical protein
MLLTCWTPLVEVEALTSSGEAGAWWCGLYNETILFRLPIIFYYLSFLKSYILSSFDNYLRSSLYVIQTNAVQCSNLVGPGCY